MLFLLILKIYSPISTKKGLRPLVFSWTCLVIMGSAFHELESLESEFMIAEFKERDSKNKIWHQIPKTLQFQLKYFWLASLLIVFKNTSNFAFARKNLYCFYGFGLTIVVISLFVFCVSWIGWTESMFECKNTFCKFTVKCTVDCKMWIIINNL